ncbi:MAG TPA: hypothetical protein IGR64_00295 [Leptolyngbyaceae cyanobacterium M65_K2018_010]|nr:hypothetical protein [Leptolyngbyaceae cyanobacterium M65_K2018_010]
MEIPQAIIDDLILTLHQARHGSVLLGGTSGKKSQDVTLHANSLRHRNQKHAIETAIGAVLEFASDDVKARLASSYNKSADLHP